MKFYLSKYKTNKPPENAEFPCITLYQDTWNDYTYYTLFQMNLWVEKSELVEVGTVKILQIEENEIVPKTKLPNEFNELGSNYCSLGQGKKYYDELIEHSLSFEVLSALRDIIIFPNQAEIFSNFYAFEHSLIRFSEALDIYKKGDKRLSNLTQTRLNPDKKLLLNFEFQYQSLGFSFPHKISFDFSKKDSLPHRITAFVGKNGTGKTAIMSELAKRFSGISNEPDVGFETSRPEFSRAIAISYSPFGPFKYPLIQTSSYRYCGLLTKNGKFITSALLENRLKKEIKDIFDSELKEIWLSSFENAGLFDCEPVLCEMPKMKNIDKIFELFKKLSSGHYYTALLLTDIVSNLIEDSILLIDEPELYLHPNMLSGLMRSIDEILNQKVFNSYAIIATHSPIVIQEIPSRSIRVFSRVGDEPYCQSLTDFESFGENLTNIVTQVFGATRADKNYMQILERLSSIKTEDEIDSLFDGKLGMSALAFVSALKSPKKEENKR